MTHLDDDTLSAVLDGESTAAARAHLDSCGVCRDRLGTFGAVASAVAAPVAPRAPADVDRAVAAAMEQARPVALFRRPWARAAVGVAAALVLAGGIGGALLRRRSGTATSTASRAAPAPSPVRQPAQGATAGPVGPSAAVGVGAAPEGTDLGAQSDPAALARVVRSHLADRAGGAVAASPLAGAAPACQAPAAAASGVGAATAPALVATVVWRGEAALTYVFDRRQAVVIRRSDCAVLATVPL